MKSLAVIGAQWGDEGKGKITDFLSQKVDHVIRFQGGNNAGHTIWVGDVKTVLHVIPSGILNPNNISIIDHGVVFDPQNFLKEIAGLEAASVKVTPENLKVSGECSIITSYHKLLDEARETNSNNSIGTTKKGIGPTYEDRVSRKGIKLKHLVSLDLIKDRLENLFLEKQALFDGVYKMSYPSIDEEANALFDIGQKILPFVCDTFAFLNEKPNSKNLFEGAQGVLLDKDFGSYPFVTSSSTSYAGIFSGSSSTQDKLDEVIGIAKAYTTRVGSGPFPTELFDDNGNTLGVVGHEFGATTGRKRRCGWLDIPLLRYATKVSRFTSIALTKVDVLCALKELKVCYAYEYEGEEIKCAFPGIDFEKIKPLYKSFTPFTNCFDGEALEENLNAYINYIEDELGIKVSLVGYGPERDELFHRNSMNIH